MPFGNPDSHNMVMKYANYPYQVARYTPYVARGLGYNFLAPAVAAYAAYPRKTSNTPSLRGSVKKVSTPVTPVTVVPKKKLRTVRPKKSIKAKVRQLEKSLKADQAYHTHKSRSSKELQCAIKECNQTTIGGTSVPAMETACANLEYYDPATPGTLVKAAGATGNYSRDIHFKSISSSITVRNSYQVPCEVRIYLVIPKQDTNLSPMTYYSDGITDQVETATTDIYNPLIYLTDIDLLKEAYRIKLLKKKYLNVGSQVSASHTVKDIDYDPSMFDSHAMNYQAKYKNFMFIVRVDGVLHHDSGNNAEYGSGAAGVDMTQTTVYKIVYDAGTNLNRISWANTDDTTYTTGPVTGVKSVPDNTVYTVS